MSEKIGVIGVGNMGGAIVSAVAGADFGTENISMCAHSVPDKIKKLNINETNLTNLISKSDYIILCIKPNGFARLLGDIKKVSGYESKVYVSVAAGITISSIKEILGDVKAVRTMPNLPMMCFEGMTAISRCPLVSDDELCFVRKIFALAGKTVEVEERLIDSCTAINGSGPAYVFMFIEALADAAVKQGVKRSDAYVLASQTVLGSAAMQLETGLHPAVLKDMVCSPGGTTIAAVASLEENGFRSAVMAAVDACAAKAKALGEK